MRFIKLLISIYVVFWAGQIQANECLSQMPAGMQPDGQLKLCRSGFTGMDFQYSCQDYKKAGQHYRVIYKGGLEPRAIVKLEKNGAEKLVWSPSFGDHLMRCPLAPPTNIIHKHARHRGVGVCIDEHNRNIPCSVFEHAAARKSTALRYLVFYTAQGQAELAHTMVAGDNQDAMVAELAYQLGLSLMDTRCCSEQATAYLEYAHRLFPRVNDYRAGYLEALLDQLAANEKQ